MLLTIFYLHVLSYNEVIVYVPGDISTFPWYIMQLLLCVVNSTTLSTVLWACLLNEVNFKILHRTEVLTNLIIVIISQHICVSNCHIVHLNSHMLYVNNISKKLRGIPTQMS